jgi:ribose transport system ATP-binding protein
MNEVKDYIFTCDKMNKSFGSTHANNNISISIKEGEVRGLIGENGSGKSTLISMIAGMQSSDSGSMSLNGEPYQPHNSQEANQKHIGTVVQELGLVDGLPVGANIFLGRMNQFTKNGIVDLSSLNQEGSKLFDQWGFQPISMNILAGTLSVEQKKIVELIRALSVTPNLLILDEITAALSLNNRKRLYSIIEKLKGAGNSILIATHDLEEMLSIADSVTIMRDGTLVTTKPSSELTVDSLKQLMVGREINGSYYRADQKESYKDRVVLRGEHLSAERFNDISFQLHEGEILGFCGLSDAGIHELGEALFGIRKLTSGQIQVGDSLNTVVNSTKSAIKNGIGYVPKDRDKQALMVDDSIENNICLPSTNEIQGTLGMILPRRRKEISEKAIKNFDIKTQGRNQIVRSLSGGNRQKVNLARWVKDKTKILILDCPTRGVDVGVKSYIYNAMNQAKSDGISMIVISDELPELIGMCDTILVMKNKKLVLSKKRSEGLTEESLIEVML